MTVSGLTIVRHGVRLDYPFREAIRSALPLCDEFVVVVGAGDDGTLEAVRALAEPKVRVVESVWSDRVVPRKCVLAQQTNLGLHLCRGDWAIYLQATEVLHEASLPRLRAAMERWQGDPRVEALLLERLTFWGDYGHVVAAYPDRFKYSARIVRPYVGAYSVRDAMSIAVFDGFSLRGRWPRAVDTGEDLYRYSYVCTPQQFRAKLKGAVHLSASADMPVGDDHFYRAFPVQCLRPFAGAHPAVMADRVRAHPAALRDDDPRWRRTPTLRERWRLLETRWYARFGLPRWRQTRYRLIGDYRPKDRGATA